MKKMMIFLAVLFVYNYMPAQVTIGMLEEPHSGALLEVKESNDVGLNTPNSTKGILFPKVSLVSSTSLEPLCKETGELQKVSSLGMIVYNVNDKADGINTGLCVWNGEEWTLVEGGDSSGAADFSVHCEGSLKVTGSLAKGKSLNPINNSMELPVDVQKTGRYSILASTKNGYYFSSTGEFLQKGQYHVVLNGMGSPVEATTETKLDTLSFFINGIAVDLKKCIGEQTLVVEDIEPKYFIIQPIDVSATNLLVNQSGTGFMTVRVQVAPEAFGAYYHIETDYQDGIKFEGSGILGSTTTQQITLACNGAKPPKAGILTFEITSNSTDSRNGTIMVDAPVKGRTIKVAVMCNNPGDDWNLVQEGDYRGGAGKLLRNKALFGPDSKYCPIENIEVTQSYAQPSLVGIDILIISYSSYPTDIAAINTFINNGGAVIHCFQPGDQHRELMRSVLGSNSITREDLNTIPNQSQYSVVLTGVAQDSIVNNGGYISDLSGKNFGYDGGDNSYFNNVPPANVDILATDITGTRPSILKSKTKTYLLLGDGAPFSGGFKNWAEGIVDFRPLMVTADYFPAIKNYGFHKNVYNAHLFINAMIWAINRRLAVAP